MGFGLHGVKSHRGWDVLGVRGSPVPSVHVFSVLGQHQAPRGEGLGTHSREDTTNGVLIRSREDHVE